MYSIIYTVISLIFIYIAFKLIDRYFPTKSTKNAIVLRKHTEDSFQTQLDSMGGGHNVNIKKFMLTIQGAKTLRIETVDIEKYNQAIIGQPIKVVKLWTRFTKHFIKFELELEL